MAYDYDIVIIGGGSGGLVAASSTAQLDLKVLLIEKERLGGDCLWHGCVPSKSLIAVAKRAKDIRTADRLGLPGMDVTPDFRSVMDRMRAVQAAIEPHDSPERFRKLGATVEFGSPAFVSRHELMLNEQRVTFKYAIIATGSSPRVPPIAGLEETGYLTNVDVFGLEELPAHLAVIGGGPVGTELAQVFARLGSRVTMLVRSRLLGREDRNLVKKLQACLEKDGVEFRFGVEPAEVGVKDGRKYVKLSDGSTMVCDDILLIATGRSPNVDGLQLEQAGVAYSGDGIETDPYLRTTAKNIYAIGDVVGGKQFTHMAASHASTAVRNIVTPILKARAEDDVVPWVTFTDPELARVGRLPSEGTEELVFPYGKIDRAIAEDAAEGEIRVVITPRGKVLGASILGQHAGELIMEYALAMKHGLSIQDLAGTIHPYPTFSSGSWTLAGSYYKRFLSDRVKRLTQFLVRRL